VFHTAIVTSINEGYAFVFCLGLLVCLSVRNGLCSIAWDEFSLSILEGLLWNKETKPLGMQASIFGACPKAG